MYKKNNPDQLNFNEFELSFGGTLNKNNRWIKLSGIIPWSELESIYSGRFSSSMGRTAKPFRMAFGALVIKAKMNWSDQETVDQICENPYLQYFIGLTGFIHEPPFDASLMVHFRKRLKLDDVNAINEIIHNAQNVDRDDTNKNDGVPVSNDHVSHNQFESEKNTGMLKLDATVAPADITYPTDVKLLNKAREASEEIIDHVCALFEIKKPRTYRRNARRDYLRYSKKRKHKGKTITRAIKQQLQYLKRNISSIQRTMEHKDWSKCDLKLLQKFWILQEVFRQQNEMYRFKRRSIAHRIVSMNQPHVRPIKRGKAGAETEFGAKIAISVADGINTVDRISWEAFNEGTELERQVEQYRKKNGCYPECVCGDNIYGSKKNRKYLTERGIRFSGKKLGRISTKNKKQKVQQRKDAAERNEVEGCFGVGKRKYNLDRIMMKLPHTSEMWIAMIFLVINLDVWLRKAVSFFVLLKKALVYIFGQGKNGRIVCPGIQFVRFS